MDHYSYSTGRGAIILHLTYANRNGSILTIHSYIFLIILNETVSFNHVRSTNRFASVAYEKVFSHIKNGTLGVQRGGACCRADVSVSNVPSNTQGTSGNYLLQMELFRQCFCPIKPR